MENILKEMVGQGELRMETSIKSIRENLKFSNEAPIKTELQASPQLKVIRVCLKKGVKIPPHTGDHVAFFLIIEGKGIFTRGDEKIELKKDEFLFINENVERGIEALEDLVLIVTRN